MKYGPNIAAWRRKALRVALESGHTKESIGRDIGTSGNNVAKIVQRGSSQSKYSEKLDQWLSYHCPEINVIVKENDIEYAVDSTSADDAAIEFVRSILSSSLSSRRKLETLQDFLSRELKKDE